jgi:xylulokinase
LQFSAFQASNPDLAVAEIVAYGGGTRSALWNQIKADVIGVPHVLLDREDMAPIGNAILAGYALGVYDDMARTAEQFVRHSARFDPRPEVHAFYRDYAHVYEKLLNETQPAFAEIAHLPTWEKV